MTDQLEDHITATDAFTLNLERDPLLRATIVAVATFDRAPKWSTLVDRVERASRLTPRFREKLVTVPWGLAPPRWIVDPHFELPMHLRRGRVPRQGGIEAVIEFARVAGMTAFDHDRPLWEFTLLEGLPDKGAALVMKFHHALTDGVGGIEMAAHVVDLERRPPDPGPLPPAPVATHHGPAEILTDTFDYHRRRVTDAAVELIRLGPRTVGRTLSDPVTSLTDGLETARAVARFSRPVTRTLSPIMTERRPRRDCGTLDVPLDSLLDAAHRVDATLNDAFLAAIAGGMRLYHERHLALVDHLCLCMPINVRTEADGPGGNRVTLERFDLPVGVTDPEARMVEISRICRELRNDRAIPYSGAIAGVLNLLPVDITGGMFKHVDLLASNVPGFGDEVFVGGALLESFHVFGATLGSAANVTLMSYRDTCHLGIVTDSGAVRDPDVFRESLADGFAEVIEER